jgi:hypothetical protein
VSPQVLGQVQAVDHGIDFQPNARWPDLVCQVHVKLQIGPALGSATPDLAIRSRDHAVDAQSQNIQNSGELLDKLWPQQRPVCHDRCPQTETLTVSDRFQEPTVEQRFTAGEIDLWLLTAWSVSFVCDCFNDAQERWLRYLVWIALRKHRVTIPALEIAGAREMDIDGRWQRPRMFAVWVFHLKQVCRCEFHNQEAPKKNILNWKSLAGSMLRLIASCVREISFAVSEGEFVWNEVIAVNAWPPSWILAHPAEAGSMDPLGYQAEMDLILLPNRRALHGDINGAEKTRLDHEWFRKVALDLRPKRRK